MAALTRRDAEQGRFEMLAHAAHCARRADDKSLRWGLRYEAAVIGDHCLDIAKEYDAYLRDLNRVK